MCCETHSIFFIKNLLFKANYIFMVTVFCTNVLRYVIVDFSYFLPAVKTIRWQILYRIF